MNEYDAMLYIRRQYGPDVLFRTADAAKGKTFQARYVAVWVGKKWWNSGPAYHVHAVNALGYLGQPVETVPFEEVRHVGA
jgi:hypothetical protein